MPALIFLPVHKISLDTPTPSRYTKINTSIIPMGCETMEAILGRVFETEDFEGGDLDGGLWRGLSLL